MIDDIVGKTIWRIEQEKDWNDDVHNLIFRLDDLSAFEMYDQEFGSGNDVKVRLQDISGDLEDLLGEPLVLAEMSKNIDGALDEDQGSNWTFYRFATQKGYVTLRWMGESNGYYSEEVATLLCDDKINVDHPDYLGFLAQREKKHIHSHLEESAHDHTSRVQKKM